MAIIQYITGDLFTSTESLAHCISEDCVMGAGIAVHFKRRFQGVLDLKSQMRKPGQCAVLKRNNRFIYYLVTKKRYCDKPTYTDLRKSLEHMKLHCLQNNVNHVSIPKIGCGLDGLQWSHVANIIESVFHNTNITLTVYML
ncbi:ADP-ribose glycohydrolase [Scale drop disease virus]|uniref:ADP-ribose glycohydrolase n=1 Tax=Scale drop disease virus TaxID=1697349 RepID=A0A0K1L789_9VIRU|nr:ORF_090L [Scale drop disease virus]AKU37505.1 ORF_090L [Scale drop disease virus]QLI60764.1 ADP-ribose glycohydrolase [Scale drop disease virus]QXJ13682.1 ORF090L [Scale drop disease virus]UNH60691.1 ADP-ribose glycohydrolase [Scale drop disease virus]